MAAAREALEEAGVIGTIAPAPLGRYVYDKILRSGAAVRTEVAVFPMVVSEELAEWPEASVRTRRWFSLTEAAAQVDEPDLGVLILGFRVPAI